MWPASSATSKAVFQKVSSALGQWVTDLEQAQAQSVQALDQAEGPYRQMGSLQAQTVPSGSNLTALQQQQVQSRNTAVQRALGELDAAKALLARATGFRDSQASRYAAIINKAIDDRAKDSWWQSHVLDSGLMQWVDQHADTVSIWLSLPGRRANAGHYLRLDRVTGKVHPFATDSQVSSIAPAAVYAACN